jgi:hypothetical protein
MCESGLENQNVAKKNLLENRVNIAIIFSARNSNRDRHYDDQRQHGKSSSQLILPHAGFL